MKVRFTRRARNDLAAILTYLDERSPKGARNVKRAPRSLIPGRWSLFSTGADRHHLWVAERIRDLDALLLVCEPVLAEAMYLLARFPRARDTLLGLLENGALAIAFRMGEHVAGLRNLHRKYRDRPISLADACVVRMAEIFERHAVLTLDSDFLIYRKHGRAQLTLIYPQMSG